MLLLIRLLIRWGLIRAVGEGATTAENNQINKEIGDFRRPRPQRARIT
jgi:hypothetical protein